MVIILYIMDSLRPDFLSCYGYGKNTSPNIDRLSEEGVIFTNAFAQSTWTRSSGASLLSSTYPSVHGVLTVDDMLPETLPTLPEQLKRYGFHTIAISAIGNISPGTGFGRGFDRFIELYKDPVVCQKRPTFDTKNLDWERKRFVFEGERVPIPTSSDINDALFPLLEERDGIDTFIFIWSLDTHDPYFHRDPALSKFCDFTGKILWSKDVVAMRSDSDLAYLRSVYEDMIYYNDYHIGVLTGRLKDLGLFDQTLLVLTSDHGESFGEHGVTSHGGAPYDEVIRVPLVMRFPESQFVGRFSHLVQHIDVAPTIHESIGFTDNSGLGQGKTLLHAVRDQIPCNQYVVAESQLKTKLPRFTSVRSLTHKFIKVQSGKFDMKRPLSESLQRLIWTVSKPRMLFDLLQDPEEKENIVRKEPEIAQSFQASIQEISKENGQRAKLIQESAGKRSCTDKAVAKQLKALGYFDN